MILLEIYIKKNRRIYLTHSVSQICTYFIQIYENPKIFNIHMDTVPNGHLKCHDDFGLSTYVLTVSRENSWKNAFLAPKEQP